MNARPVKVALAIVPLGHTSMDPPMLFVLPPKLYHRHKTKLESMEGGSYHGRIEVLGTVRKPDPASQWMIERSYGTVMEFRLR